MKKTLFVKFLFLLLCGSVLTTAGCKDYDDDIDFSGFAKKSDISSLQTQIEGCVKDSDLAAKIVAAIESSLADGALQENLNSLKSGILEEIAGIYATQETLESVQETLENMIELSDAAHRILPVGQWFRGCRWRADRQSGELDRNRRLAVDRRCYQGRTRDGRQLDQ